MNARLSGITRIDGNDARFHFKAEQRLLRVIGLQFGEEQVSACIAGRRGPTQRRLPCWPGPISAADNSTSEQEQLFLKTDHCSGPVPVLITGRP